jgi:hypothetical protein
MYKLTRHVCISYAADYFVQSNPDKIILNSKGVFLRHPSILPEEWWRVGGAEYQ